MAFQDVADLDCDTSYALGGFNKKTKKDNPTSVEGYYIGSRNVPSPKSKTGFAKLHVFQTPEGNHGVWGKTNLDQKLAAVPPGFLTRVTFTGMKETKNNPMYTYRVQVDKDADPIEVNTASSEDTGYGSTESADQSDEEYLAEQEIDADEEPADQVQAQRAQPPKTAAKPPTADAQRKVMETLRGRR